MGKRPSTVGRRTNQDILLNKKIRVREDGIEYFEDYFTSSDSSSVESDDSAASKASPSTPRSKQIKKKPFTPSRLKKSDYFIASKTSPDALRPKQVGTNKPITPTRFKKNDDLVASKTMLSKLNIQRKDKHYLNIHRPRQTFKNKRIAIGRRSGFDLLHGKEIRLNDDNVENFEDYFTDTASERDSRHSKYSGLHSALSSKNVSPVKISETDELNLNPQNSSPELQVAEFTLKSNQTRNLESEQEETFVCKKRNSKRCISSDSFDSNDLRISQDLENSDVFSTNNMKNFNNLNHKYLKSSNVSSPTSSQTSTISEAIAEKDFVVNPQKKFSFKTAPNANNQILDVPSPENISKSPQKHSTQNQISEIIKSSRKILRSSPRKSHHLTGPHSPNASNQILNAPSPENVSKSPLKHSTQNQKDKITKSSSKMLRSSIRKSNSLSVPHSSNLSVSSPVLDDVSKTTSTALKSVTTKPIRKKQKTNISKATDTANDDLEQTGLRRSKRYKVPRLQMWRNECVHVKEYGPNGEILSADIVGSESYNTAADRLMKKLEKAKEKRKAKSKEKSKLADNTVNFKHIKESINKVAVINPYTTKEESVYLYRPFSSLLWSVPELQNKDNPPYAISKCMSGELISFGYLEIGASQKKEEQHSPADNITFVVMKGCVKIIINKTKLKLKTMDTVTVPATNAYSIHNTGNTDALLYFSAYKVPLFKFQFEASQNSE